MQLSNKMQSIPNAGFLYLCSPTMVSYFTEVTCLSNCLKYTTTYSYRVLLPLSALRSSTEPQRFTSDPAQSTLPQPSLHLCFLCGCLCMQTQLHCWAIDEEVEGGSGKVSGGLVWCGVGLLLLANKQWEVQYEDTGGWGKEWSRAPWGQE